MTPCEVCGNEYDKPLEITLDGEGHLIYCCAHCAKEAGVVGIDDRV